MGYYYKFKNITYFEDCWFIDVVKNKNTNNIVGGIAYDACKGDCTIKAKAVIIAAGGLSTLFFPKTDYER